MSLSVLESRLLRELPEECRETIEKEFARYEVETARLSEDDEKVGQATLTRREIQRATTTNQNGEHGHTIVELQCIKAVALKYDVDDWLSYVDPTLTYEENMTILKEKCDGTMKDMQKR